MIENKFQEFVEIVKILRKECPWDREQTNDSIKAATIEEAYEVVEAIDNKDYAELKKELGDLLLHVVFHTTIAEESNHFKLENVIDSIQEKLIRRHPHVFGNTEVNGADEVKKNWETIKLKEGRKSVVDGVPVSLPALQRAHRLQEKVSKVGFDWENKQDVWKKVIEEIEEMHEIENLKSLPAGKAGQNSQPEADQHLAENLKNEELNKKLESEIGDVFFALVNYSRFLGINPENALRRTNEKFIKRFNYVEKKILESGRSLNESNLKEMDVYWEESKKDF
ncbi:MAG: nucleoside triphosphate pyrophosphohydrolase [Ignavibacteria bacterium GWA2_35_9]|nr:MAG: nucleoside triphosphate pyrophosphohydrolase [Ignavibacteria bacterium GWA2_35_9]OGU47380.1 MAG: nucleoside triphosphate pyrophosphohydrolase [Ignavibacteria bacterium GWB2_36_8]OGU51390.1 MAG: nucleoside triphosphate pyrophosphohydrolase [Ignavibacteria bacterium GWC2_36_12]